MSEIKLKPCPFCGGEASVYKWRYASDYLVACRSCRVMVDNSYMSEAEAAEAWNKRAERRGHWVNREHCQVDEDAYDVADCSNCGMEITLSNDADSFCPNCGARMDEGASE